MADFHVAAHVGEIPDGQGKTVELGGKSIALFNDGGKYYATDNGCLHRGGPLGEGHVKDHIVSCPWHMWGFDITSGVCTVNPEFKIETYPVKVEGNDILVGL